MTKQEVEMRELDELHASDRVNEDERSAFEAQTGGADAHNGVLAQDADSEKPHHAMATAKLRSHR